MRTACLLVVVVVLVGTSFAQTTRPARNWKLAPLSEVKASADAGVAEAQLELGYRIEAGKGMKKDQDEANGWFRKAAEQGVVEAQSTLASRLMEGTAADQKEGTLLFEQAADAGDVKAMREAGMCYKEGKGVLADPAKAVEFFKRAAAKGDAAAEYQLGMCYRKGEGVGEDQKEAAKWLKQASSAGNGDATAELATMTLKGEGVPKDQREAVNLLLRAANKGSAPAQWQLAKMYRDGDGVGRDEAKALLWMKKLVAEKYAPAEAALAHFNVDAFKQAAKPLGIHAGAVDETQVGALVKVDGDVIAIQNGVWKLAVKAFAGRQYSMQVTPPTYVPSANGSSSEDQSGSNRRAPRASASDNRVHEVTNKADAAGSTGSVGMDPAKVKEGMAVSVWGTLVDTTTVKGIICQLAPPSFEWKYQMDDVGGVRAGNQNFPIEVSFKNTGRTPLKNVVLHVRGYQQSSPNDFTKDFLIKKVDVGETISFKLNLKLYNYSAIGGVSKPKVEMEVTGYEY